MFVIRSAATITVIVLAVLYPEMLGTVPATWGTGLIVTVSAWRFIPRCICAPEEYRDEAKEQEPIPAARLVRGKEGRHVR